ncbi:MAG: adenylate/guanylate cyclase domain-containing protein [Desulfomonilaceae bacterium]
MARKAPELATKVLTGARALTILGNVLGACLMFIYFELVEAGLTFAGKQPDLGANLRVFLVGTGAVGLIISVISYRVLRPLRNGLVRFLSGREVESLELLAGRYLNLPIHMAGVSLFGWLISGVIFTFMPPAFEQFHQGDVRLAFRLLVSMYLVGAPATVAFIYFVLEWRTRKSAVELFPQETLTDVPSTFRTNVLPKMLSFSFMIGTIPLCLVSFITLDQIGLIQSDPKHVSVFASQMPHVLLFILWLAVVAVATLSFLMSRSVSEPLQRMGDAMKRIREGELNVSIPVVSNDEIGVMAAGFNSMAEGLRERDFIRETFGSYVSHEVAAEILTSNTGVNLAGELRDISILVSDLRGFTRLSATIEPQLVLKMINAYLETMTEVIVRHDGTIDEIMGDGLLVFFGAPRRAPDHARRAVECALAMQSALLLLNEEYEKQSLPPLEMGIGINCGELVVGSIGSEKRRKYGAMGGPINVAYRVEAQTSGGQILVTPEIHERLGPSLIVRGHWEVSLKGIEQPVILYQVVGIKDP